MVDWIREAEICRNAAAICGSAEPVGGASSAKATVSVVIAKARNASAMQERTGRRKRLSSEKMHASIAFEFHNRYWNSRQPRFSRAVSQVSAIEDLTCGSRDTKY